MLLLLLFQQGILHVLRNCDTLIQPLSNRLYDMNIAHTMLIMFLKNRGQQLGQETNRMAGQERGREDDKRGGGVVISPYTWEQQHGQDQPSQETDGECWRRASHSSM